MKSKKLIICLLVVLSLQACNQTPTNKPGAKITTSPNNDEIIKELKTFYTKYFSEMENTGKTSEKNLDILRQEYMSTKLYEKLKKIDIGYDAVINGQDVDPEWKKTLTINYIGKDVYEVCTVASFDKAKYCTYLKVEKTDNKYKIYDIKVNDIISILNYSSKNNDKIDADAHTEYDANGEWRINCGSGVANITIQGKEASLVVLSNQVYIDLVEVKRDDSEKKITYKLKEIPEDKGSFGSKLPWQEYLNEQEIVAIKKIDENTLKFYWYGFYNKKTKKRELTDSEFNQENTGKEVTLKKCSE